MNTVSRRLFAAFLALIAVVCIGALTVLGQGVSGLSVANMREYLQYIADRRLEAVGCKPVFGSRNPFAFMELQDVQELTNFFERRVSAYQVAVQGEICFDAAF